MLNFNDIKNVIEKDGTYYVKANQKGKLLINLDHQEEINLVIEENCNVDALIVGEEKAKVCIDIKDYSSVNLNVFANGKACDSSLAFNLFEGASLLVAYADFSLGEKNLDAKVNLKGRHSSVNWHLATLTRNKDKKNYIVNFDHIVGETFAKMDNYGVCRDESSLFFLGDAVIEKGAKKSSTNQIAKIMLFDPKCHAKASPKLCIYENDVDASHGASEGQINQDHVFYLTSRGISENEAKRLITLGYLSPIMQYFFDEDIKKEIEDCIINRV